MNYKKFHIRAESRWWPGGQVAWCDQPSVVSILVPGVGGAWLPGCRLVSYGVLCCGMVCNGVLLCAMVWNGVLWCAMHGHGVEWCGMVCYAVRLYIMV